jgi:CBS domain containing-hemolysin-like protein
LRADALRDAAEGDDRAAAVAELLEDRPRLQPALGAVHTFLLALAAIPATWALTVTYRATGLLIALVVLGLLLVFIGDLLPRSIGRRRPQRLAYRLSWWLRLAVGLGMAAVDVVTDDEDDEDDYDDSEETDAEERQLIESVIDFTDTIVREVMTPRTDMVAVRSDAGMSDALDVIIERGRSRIPVLGQGPDDVLGILYARDLLRAKDDDLRTCGDLMRPVYLVPETKRVAELLREMQERQIHMAIVVDEFGGTAGLVTIEDLLEELVGEIVDEHDEEEPMVTSLEGGGYLLDARLGIDEFSDLIGVEVPDDEWDTVGGLLLGLAGRVPEEGESFEFGGHKLVADQVRHRRIQRVRLLTRS